MTVPPFSARVVDAGEGHVTVAVAREADAYPTPGDEVLVIPDGTDDERWTTEVIRALVLAIACATFLAVTALAYRAGHDAGLHEDTRTRAALCQVLDQMGADATTAAQALPCADTPAHP